MTPSQANSIHINQQKSTDQEVVKKPGSHVYGICKSAWDLACMFGKRTTIHGVNRLLGETAGRYERVVWFITVILAFFGSIYVCLLLSRRFKEGKFQTVVDSTRQPVYKIYFPVITICNLNRLNWDRIDEAKERFLPNETSPEKLKLFERIVGTFDDIRFANFDKFDVLKGEPIELLNHINFTTVVDFMTWRCEELLKSCEWRHHKINCCKIFSKRRSKSGPCWAFNTLETEEGRLMQRTDKKWPWRIGAAGPTSGLQVRVLINPDKHFPNRTNEKGLSVMVTEVFVWHREHFRVAANTETLIEIDPVIFYYDNDTRSVSSSQRECVFDDERSSADFKSLFNYIYMNENCQAECHQEYLMRYCNCTTDLLFPPGQYPACKVKDLLCLAEHNNQFLYSHEPGEELFVENKQKGMTCKCFRNCYSLYYVADVRSSHIPREVRNNLTYVDLDVHYRFETMVVYRTSLVFNWVDLMVAFGGIAGLFLGCSLISAMELVYFACIEIPKFIFERIRCGRSTRTTFQDENDSHTNFGNGKLRLNKIKERNQFNDALRLNNLSNDVLETSMDKGQLLKWQRLIENNVTKPLNNENNSYY